LVAKAAPAEASVSGGLECRRGHGHARRGVSKTVLVVDDEPHIVRQLAFVLGHAGFEVSTADNGVDAMASVRSSRPSVVLLDVMMPRKNGYEVCREIKDDPDLRGIVVVLLTAKGQPGDRERGLAAGADDYVLKPFSPAEVVQRVRELAG